MVKTEQKKHRFPTAYTVIIIVLLLIELLTYFIPAGNYATLSYNSENNNFVITKPNGDTQKIVASQNNLDKYKINIPIQKFKDGTIFKPVAIPNSYERISAQKPNLWQAIVNFFTVQVQGIVQSIDIIAFVLILGGCIGIVNANGAINSGIAALSKKIKGKQVLLIVVIMAFVSIGGTTYGLAEETMAMYPILIPVFLMAGYDTMTVIGTVFLADSIGTMVSTINPFSTIIASNAAGVNFSHALPMRIIMWAFCTFIGMLYVIHYAERVRKHPETSYVYDQYESDRKKFLSSDNLQNPKFTWQQKLTLSIFAIAFIVIIWGVQSQGWYFTEISVIFLAAGYLMAIFSGLDEHKVIDAFVNGASELLGVALTIGLARGVSIIMDNSHTSDTIMNFFSKQISGLPPLVFIWLLFIVYIVLGFFIQSSSGLAVLSMPIMAPLANVVGIDRASVIDAYNLGQGYISLIAPTGLILMGLMMVGIDFSKWFKWCWKLLVIEFILCLMFLALGLLVY